MKSEIEKLSLQLKMMHEEKKLTPENTPKNLLNTFWLIGNQEPEKMFQILNDMKPLLDSKKLESWQIYALCTGLLGAVNETDGFPWNFEFTIKMQTYNKLGTEEGTVIDKIKIIPSDSYWKTYNHPYKEFYDQLEEMIMEIIDETIELQQIDCKKTVNRISGITLFDMFLNPKDIIHGTFKEQYERTISLPRQNSIIEFKKSIDSLIVN